MLPSLPSIPGPNQFGARGGYLSGVPQEVQNCWDCGATTPQVMQATEAPGDVAGSPLRVINRLLPATGDEAEAGVELPPRTAGPGGGGVAAGTPIPG